MEATPKAVRYHNYIFQIYIHAYFTESQVVSIHITESLTSIIYSSFRLTKSILSLFQNLVDLCYQVMCLEFKLETFT